MTLHGTHRARYVQGNCKGKRRCDEQEDEKERWNRSV